jgi:hypothetical protein
VRIVQSCIPSRIGVVATVIGSPTKSTKSDRKCYPLDIPAGIDPRDGQVTTNEVRADWLEPIYDGNEPVSWSECAWQPNSVRV